MSLKPLHISAKKLFLNERVTGGEVALVSSSHEHRILLSYASIIGDMSSYTGILGDNTGILGDMSPSILVYDSCIRCSWRSLAERVTGGEVALVSSSHEWRPKARYPTPPFMTDLFGTVKGYNDNSFHLEWKEVPVARWPWWAAAMSGVRPIWSRKSTSNLLYCLGLRLSFEIDGLWFMVCGSGCRV